MIKRPLWPLLAALLLVSTVSYAEDGCFVARVEGRSQLTHAGKNVPLTKDAQLSPGDTIQTFEGSVDLVFNDTAGLRLLPSTMATIDAAEPTNMSATLIRGNVLANLKKIPRGSGFYVTTPTAVAAARGTQFWGRVDMAQGITTTFAVREGEIEVRDRSSSKKFPVKTGEALDLTMGQTGKVRKALAEEMAAMKPAAEIPVTLE